jgi:DNA topoisomerase IA
LAGVLPPSEGQTLDGAFAAVDKQTTPPPRYTEATLLDAMESAGKRIDDDALRLAVKDCGLGTPATRASIIETLLHRSYIERPKQHLAPTPPAPPDRRAAGREPGATRAHGRLGSSTRPLRAR